MGTCYSNSKLRPLLMFIVKGEFSTSLFILQEVPFQELLLSVFGFKHEFLKSKGRIID